jgi:hypothetical protein
LRNSASRQVFIEDGAEEALRVIEVPPPDTNLEHATLLQLARELQRRLAHMELRDHERMKANTQDPDREALSDTKAVLDEILGLMTGDEVA